MYVSQNVCAFYDKLEHYRKNHRMKTYAGEQTWNLGLEVFPLNLQTHLEDYFLLALLFYRCLLKFFCSVPISVCVVMKLVFWRDVWLEKNSPHFTLKVVPPLPLLVHLFGPTSLPISVSSNVAKVQGKDPHGSFGLFHWRCAAIRDCRGYHVRGFARLFNSAARHFIEVWPPPEGYSSLWRCFRSKHGEAWSPGARPKESDTEWMVNLNYPSHQGSDR